MTFAPVKQMKFTEFMRLEIIDWIITHVILPLCPLRTNDGVLIVQHIHSLMSHRLKETPAENLNWTAQ